MTSGHRPAARRGRFTTPLAALGVITTLATTAAPSQAMAQNFVGLAVSHEPRHEGSRDRTTGLRPLVNFERGPLFVSSRAGLPAVGLQTVLGPGWTAGVFLGYDKGRELRAVDRTLGLQDIDGHAVVGAHLQWRHDRFAIDTAYRHATRSGHGGVLQWTASHDTWRRGAHALSLGLGLDWSSQASMRLRFGASQPRGEGAVDLADRRTPGAGLSAAVLSARWMTRLDGRLSMIATLEARTLLGDARDSPAAQRRTAASGMVGLLYGF